MLPIIYYYRRLSTLNFREFRWLQVSADYRL